MALVALKVKSYFINGVCIIYGRE